MLINLHIKNFALIEEVDIDFQKGLNVLTGETGAGKSIIIDAVNLVLGGRASSDFIRSGEESSLVSAVFEITDMPELERFLREIGYPVEEDLLLQIQRELSAAGKNTCRINGRMVNLSTYREIGQYLLDIHGQHDHHSLLHPEKHLELLDKLGSGQLWDIKTELKGIYEELRDKLNKLKQITGGEKDRARQKDLFQFQLKEIDDARLEMGEDQKLEAEKKIAANSEKLAGLSQQVYELLYEGGRNSAALDQLNQALNSLKEIANYDDSVTGIKDIIESATYQIEEATRDLRSYKENIDFDSDRLEAIENRLDQIKTLKRKYGDTIEEIIKFRDEVAAELEIIDMGDEKLCQLQSEIEKQKENYNSLASRLSESRKKLAAALEKDISRELQELLMPHIKFKINFAKSEEPTADGIDMIEFLISPNPGEPLKPLSKIASGGELSRIMLALKTILAKVDDIPTLIFDEIDTGLGGRAAYAVAEKLSLLGRKRQVICVTHSPQVACFGENHFYINKEVQGQKTKTKINTLNEEERVAEIARMLGGKEVTELTLQHARELLAGIN